MSRSARPCAKRVSCNAGIRGIGQAGITYSADDPQEKLTRFTQVLHEVFAFGRSKKHMIQRQLGRLEPTPSLKYRAAEVMRTMPVMST